MSNRLPRKDANPFPVNPALNRIGAHSLPEWDMLLQDEAINLLNAAEFDLDDGIGDIIVSGEV